MFTIQKATPCIPSEPQVLAGTAVRRSSAGRGDVAKRQRLKMQTIIIDIYGTSFWYFQKQFQLRCRYKNALCKRCY